MASKIKIKRSGNSGSPTQLAQGELAYSFLDGDVINGGDRLYIGTGEETNGEAVNIEVIGGNYFTSKLDHEPGVVTANSSIIVDDNLSIDQLYFNGNLRLTTNQISTVGNLIIDTGNQLNILSNTSIQGALTVNEISTVENLNANGNDLNIGGNTSIQGVLTVDEISTVGNLILNPGNELNVNSNTSIQGVLTVDEINVNQSITIDGALEANDVTSKSLTQNRVVFVGLDGNLIDSANLGFDGSRLSIDGDLSVDNINIDGNSLSSTNLNGDIIFDPNGAGKIDVSSSVITGVANPVDPNDVVNLQFLNSSDFDVSADQGTSVNKLLTTGSLNIEGGSDITTTVSGSNGSATISIGLDDTNVISGNYGSTTKIPTFSVDEKGRLTSANEVDVATTLGIEGDTGSDSINMLLDVLKISGGTGIETLASNNEITLSIGQEVETNSNVQFAGGNFSGNVTIDGDLVVNGDTTSVSTKTLEVEDPLIKLALGNTTDTISIGFYGEHGNTPEKSGFFRSHEDGQFYLFKNYVGDITQSNTIPLNDISLADVNFANVDMINANVSNDVNVSGDVHAENFVGTIDYTLLNNVPTEFPPESHTHEISDVLGLPDPAGDAGRLIETDGAGGYRLISDDELRTVRALQSVAGTARDLVFFDTFQRDPGPIGVSDSGHTWIDKETELQAGEVAWSGSAFDRHRSFIVGERGAQPSGTVGASTTLFATVENNLLQDILGQSDSGFVMSAFISRPQNSSIIPLYYDNGTALQLRLHSRSRGLRLRVFSNGEETELYSSGFGGNIVDNRQPAYLQCAVVTGSTSALVSLKGVRGNVTLQQTVQIDESDNPDLFNNLFIDPTGFGMTIDSAARSSAFRRVSIESLGE